MAGFTDPVERDLLDYYIATYAPTTKYLGLFTGTPTDDVGGGLTEVPSTGAYARVSTVAADWGAAAGTAPATKSNTTVKTFPTATANWASGANLTYFGIFSAATAGTLQAFGQLGVPKPVLSGDTPSFGVGALVIKLGDVGDTF